VANNRAVAWVYLDQRATIREALRSVKPRLGRYLWLMTNVSLRAWSPLAVFYAAYFTLLFALLPHDFMSNPAAMQSSINHNPTSVLEFGVGMLILAPLLLAALVYGVLMSLRYSLSVPACVVENLAAGKAIKRSIELSLGSRGRIFVLGLLVGMVRMLLGILFGFPIILMAVKHMGQPMPMRLLFLEQIGEFLSNALIGPIYAIGLTLFYYDQRIRKEGFDIEWMMQAAGMGTPGTGVGLTAPEEA
jgi:predicted secreted protein